MGKLIITVNVIKVITGSSRGVKEPRKEASSGKVQGYLNRVLKEGAND